MHRGWEIDMARPPISFCRYHMTEIGVMMVVRHSYISSACQQQTDWFFNLFEAACNQHHKTSSVPSVYTSYITSVQGQFGTDTFLTVWRHTM